MTHYISVGLENVRARLDNDPLYKGENFERAVDRKKQIRVKKSEWDDLKKEYKLSIREGPTHVCVCCGQLFFKRSVCVRKDYSNIQPVCTNEVWATGYREVCYTCLSYVNKRKTPSMALINGLGFSDIPVPLLDLTSFEERLVSARLLFIKIRELGCLLYTSPSPRD